MTEVSSKERVAAEQALRESEERNLALLRATSDSVYEMSADGRQMIFLTGKQFVATTDEPRGDWSEQYLPNDEKPRVWAAIRRAIDTRSTFELEHRIKRIDGTQGWTFSRAIPLFDERGAIVKWFGAASDITERKQAEEALRRSEAKYRGLFDAIDVGFCIIDMLFDERGKPLDYRFLEANPAFIQQTGLTDAIGRTIRELAPAHEQFWFDVYGRIALTGAPERFEHQAEALAGKPWYEVFAFRVGAPGEHRVGVLFRDIGERKRREANAAFLYETGKALAQATALEDVVQAVAERLGRLLGLSACVFADVDEASGEADVNHGWISAAVPSLKRVFRLDDYLTPEFLRAGRAGETVVVRDTARDERTNAGSYARLAVGAFVTVPYRRDGRWLGYTAVTSVVAREWRPDEIELLQELSSRVFSRIERAAAEDALQQNQAMFSALVEHAPFGVYMVDAAFRLRSVNAGSRAVFRNVAPLLGRDFADILRSIWQEPFASEAIARFRHTLASGESFVSSPISEQRADMDVVESYDWQLHRITLPDGSHAVVCYFYDLSEQRRLQDALRAADRRKDEFLAVLAHELRNPLAPIRTSIEVLKLTDDRAIEQRLRGVIERQTDVIVHLVDDLLDVSRIGGGRIKLREERFTLAEVIALALEASRPLIQEKRHALTLELPPEDVWLDGDKMRLTQAFLNLLNNAAKYTAPEGEIAVGAVRDDRGVAVHVKDTGSGIPQEHLTSIFEMFSRLERDRGQQGLGIGLNLVKHVIELHGGRIEAQSEGPERGSDFIVWLPVVEVARVAPPAAPAPLARPAVSRRVLIVDDYEPNLETLAQLLRALGHQVATARSGEEGLRLAAGFRPEVMLLDINMPGMDGFEVARQARHRLAGSSLRIVALTGYGQADDVQRTQRAGFDAHLVKPVDVLRLQQVLSGAAFGTAA